MDGTIERNHLLFNSTIHALNFMDKNGWVYVEQTAVTDDGSTTYKYLLKKAG